MQNGLSISPQNSVVSSKEAHKYDGRRGFYVIKLELGSCI